MDSKPSSALGSRFWALWGAFTSSNLGDGLSLVAFPLLATDLTDDARLIAMVLMFRFLPFLVIGLPAGVMLDRFDRRILAMIAQVGRAAAMGFLAAAVAFDFATITIAMAAAFAVGVGEVLVDGGLPALVRDVVETNQLEVANSRLSATQTVTNMFIGPPLGALLYAIDGSIPLIATAATFLATVALLIRVPGSFKASAEDGTPRESLKKQMTVGLRYVWSHPVLRPLALTVAAFAFVGSAGNAVHVLVVTEHFGLSDFGFGLIMAVDGVASVGMSFLVAGVVRRFSHTFSLKIGIITYVISAYLLGWTAWVPALIIGSIFGGISDPSWNVVSGTIRQRLVPDEVFGRMMTAYLFIAWSMQPLGALVGGMIAQRWGSQWVFVMSGTVVGSLLAFGQPLFKAVDEALAVSADGGSSPLSDATT